MNQDKAAAVFEEWKRRFDENPEEYQDCEAFKAEPPKSYGEAASGYFLWLFDFMFPESVPGG